MKVCACCSIPWVDGKGFVGEHVFPCANDRYGWSFTIDLKDEPTTDQILLTKFIPLSDAMKLWPKKGKK